MNIIKELEKLRRRHYQCEDCFYSCPKSGECCKDWKDESECDCGADEHNARLDAIIVFLKESK